MLKTFILSLSFCFIAGTLLADPGVVIDSKGKVIVSQGVKQIVAVAGTQFNDGATIEVAQNGSATLMFSNGAVKQLSSGEKFKATRSAPGQSSGNPLVKGMAMAYNDATSKRQGPVVHGMVKGIDIKQAAAKNGDEKLSPALKRDLNSDLAKVKTLKLGRDGEALMNAQIYYKFHQYQKQVSTLLPLYKSQNPPSDMVKSLLALGYEKLENPDEAAKYK